MKTKGMKKLSKALAIFMTVFMLMGMMPQAAFANEVPADDSIIQQEQQLDDENQNIDDPVEEQQQQQEQQQQPEPDMSNVPVVASEEAGDPVMEDVSGTVYISVSDDARFIGGASPIANKAVDLSHLKDINFYDYGLEGYLYDADGDNAYEITALHLYVYVHEKILGLDWSDVNVSGSAGSIYLAGGLFGFSDENLRYDYNGAYPAVDGWGLTADRIVLKDGDFLNIAHYTSWTFWSDSATGFHYFRDGEGNIQRDFAADDEGKCSVELVRSYSDWAMGGGSAYAAEPGAKVYFGTSYGNAAGSVTTDDNGIATITFPSAGTWYVWSDGFYGAENPSDIVSAPAFATVKVKSEPNLHFTLDLQDLAEPLYDGGIVNYTLDDPNNFAYIDDTAEAGENCEYAFSAEDYDKYILYADFYTDSSIVGWSINDENYFAEDPGDGYVDWELSDNVYAGYGFNYKDENNKEYIEFYLQLGNDENPYNTPGEWVVKPLVLTEEIVDTFIAIDEILADEITSESGDAIAYAWELYNELSDTDKEIADYIFDVKTLLEEAQDIYDQLGQTDDGVVYISISDDAKYVTDGSNVPMANKAVTIAELKTVDLYKYGLGEYRYDADGDGEHEITALHLYIYVHEKILGLDWSDVNVSGSAGSIYFAGGLFGFSDENLRYDYNGAYPAVDGWGLTADQIVLKDGDYLNIAHYNSWAFWGDSATGFHYFRDAEGNIQRNFASDAEGKCNLELVRSYSDWMNGGAAAYATEPGIEVYYGTSYDNVTGSVITNDDGIAEITFPSSGTWYVWADGLYGMENSSDIVSAPAFATVDVTAAEPEPTPEPADPIDVYVTIADKGNIVMPKEKVSVVDRDASGDFTVDEVLYAAHEAEYAGGAEAGYATAETAYGLGITKLWGDTSGNYGYWLNDVSCWSLSDTVEADDHLVSFVYQNTEVWDSYSKFDKDSYAVRAEEAVTVTLEKAGYDTNWNTVFSKHNGAEIKVYSSDFKELDTDDYEVVDNGDGTYSVTIKNTESYIIAAYDNTTPIVPAVATVVVTENADLVYADAVEEKIAAIGTVTLESEEAIKEARDAYDKLNDSQKALVENVNILIDAENELIALKAGAAADETAAVAVEALIDAIGTTTIHSGEKVKDAREAYDALTDAQKVLVDNYSVLEEAEEALAALYAAAADTDHDKIYKETGKYISELGTPEVGATGGEWLVIDITRAGGECPDGYYQNVIDYVNKNINDKEQLHRSKSTDNSRVILALTSAGYDVTDVDGHNLLEGLTDMTYLKKQGINGPIWALIAFDSYDYEIPSGGDVTRDALIETILAAQHNDGGWSLSAAVDKPSDPDMTGMALQALAPYYETNTVVKAAVDKALTYVSEIQLDNGGFGSIDGTCSESCAQIIVALTALGIDPEKDDRFIKNGMSAVDAMCLFAVEGGGFAHVPNGGFNGMATEQSQYALASYYRLLNGETSLFDMTDVEMKSESEAGDSGNNDTDNDNGKEENKPQQSGNKEEAKTTTKSITKSASIKLSDNAPTEEQLAQGRENHYCEDTGVDARDNSNDILPWYIKLNVVKQEITDDQKEKVSEALGGEGEVFILKDIHFTNTKDGSEWQPTKPVKIKSPMVDIGDYENAIIVHITDDGKIELIKGTVKDGMIEFEADSFSLYGIAGTNTSINDLLVVEDDGAVVWPWIVIAIIALAAIVYLIYRRKREA